MNHSQQPSKPEPEQSAQPDQSAKSEQSSAATAGPTSIDATTNQKWFRLALCGMLSVVVLAVGLLVGIAKLGWLNDDRASINSTFTSTEMIIEMSHNLTQQLISDAITYQNADKPNKETAKATLDTTATQRKEYIKLLMQEDPDEFLRLAISSDTKASLLEDVDGIESETTLEGIIQVYKLDFAEGWPTSNSTELFLEPESKEETKKIYLPESAPVANYGSGDKVRIIGFELDGAIVPNIIADTENFIILSLADKADKPAATKRQMAVIVVNLSDANTSMYTIPTAKSMFEDVNAWYQEASYGNTYFSGKLHPEQPADFFGVYDIASPTSPCKDYTWESLGRTAAAADGFVAAGYDHMVTLLNVNTESSICGWVGLANYPGSSVFLWGQRPSQYGNTTTQIAARVGTAIHELGHNFGLEHAALNYNCKSDGSTTVIPFGGTCSINEYGDIHNTMGTSVNRAHFSADHKAFLGWIPSTNVVDITTSGVYDLYPSDLPSTGTQLIRIPLPYGIQIEASDDTAKSPHFYLLEHRVGTASLNVDLRDYDGVFLRTSSASTRSDVVPRTYLYQLGSLPGGASCPGCVTGLRPGMVFTDPHNPNLTIKVLSWTPQKATVEIDLSDTGVPPVPICFRLTPAAVMFPSHTSMPAGGGTIEYSFSVRSNDSHTCPTSATYTITPSQTNPDIVFSPTSRTVTVAPGTTSAPQIFTATIASDIPTGSHEVRFPITTPSIPNYSIVYIRTITVVGEGDEPPGCIRHDPTIIATPPSDTTTPGGSIQYDLQIINNDTAACGSVDITFFATSSAPEISFSPYANVVQYRLPGSIWNLRITANSLSNIADGSHTITFKAASTAGNTASKNVTFTVIDPNANPPTVIISGITNNQLISPTLDTKITATATHSAGIAKIEIFINNKLVATCTNPKDNTCYIFVKGSNTAIGTHTLRADAKSKNNEFGTANMVFRR